ncbi:hypothetical protein [Brachyspira sp.]|uniref:hypothetical protein n=1 Tax=Brachyspira sp. TaxID=1977261 RepID=UPI002608898D|nr:hypothetical protein [Brachyspira sp.]
MPYEDESTAETYINLQKIENLIEATNLISHFTSDISNNTELMDQVKKTIKAIKYVMSLEEFDKDVL